MAAVHGNHLSMRYKLTLLILLVSLPLLTLNIFQARHRFGHAIADELKASEELAKAISTAFENYVDKIWDTEYAIGQAIFLPTKPLPANSVRVLLQKQLTELPSLEHMAFIDPIGKVVTATHRGHGEVSLADREHFKRIVAGADEVVSDLIVSRLTHKTTFVIVRAIRDQHGRLLGAINAGVNLQKLANSLPKTGGRGYYSIVDTQGRIAFSSINNTQTFAQRLLQGEQPALLALKNQTTMRMSRFHDNVGHGDKMGVALYIPSLGWSISLVAPVEQVLHNAVMDTRRDLSLLAISGIVAILIGFAMSKSLLKPIHALQKAAHALSTGDLTARTGVTQGNDELVSTAKAFDRMAEHIEELELIRANMMQTAAHEMRNPMAGAKGVLELALRRMNENKPVDALKQLIYTAQREIDRVSTLLDEFVDAFQVQSGRIDVQMVPLNFGLVMEEALAPFQLRMNNQPSGNRLVIESDNQVEYPMLGDQRRLVQVMQNLISNAMKYSPAGGDILVQLQKVGNEIQLSVKDQGLGIPPDELHLIFDSFYRAKNVKVGGPSGVGLGLFICKNIVERHGGQITVQSAEGVGSTFHLRFPLQHVADDVSAGDTTPA